MSNQQYDRKDPTSEQQQQKGAETFLSPEERAQLQRMMGHPSDYPKQLGAWITEFLKVNPPEVSATQIRGSRGAPRFLAVDGSQVRVENTTNETTLFTAGVPARTLGKTGHLAVYLFGNARKDNASPGDITLRLRIGGTQISYVTLGTGFLGAGAQWPVSVKWDLSNADSYAEQWGMAYCVYRAGASSSQVAEDAFSGAKDMSQDQVLTLTAQISVANADNRFYKEYASVEVFNPIGV